MNYKMVLLVASGGAIGATMRYLSGVAFTRFFGASLPYGTFFVNIAGAFLMGAFITYLAKSIPTSMELRQFVAVGILGGFTTFSAFSLELVNMIERAQIATAFIYVIASVLLSVAAVFLGIFIVRNII